jgi:uncharacterized delta-60 repeat protein
MRPSSVALFGALALAALLASPGAASAQFDHRPVRFWSFTESRKAQSDVMVDSGSQQGGRLHVRHDFGGALFDLGQPFDGIATGQVTSSASGKTFDVYAQSPSGTQRGVPIGGTSHLDEYQSYERGPDQASMRITLSNAIIEAIDANGALLPTECPPALVCAPEVGRVTFTARAYTADSEFFRIGGVAYISGHQGNWTINAVTQASSQRPLWSKERFFRDVDVDGTTSGSHAIAVLGPSVRVNVDLSPLGEGQLFAVHVALDAYTIDRRGRESAVAAFIRDPQSGPALVQTTGLTALGAPPFDEPPIDALPPAECPLGADPGSGTLQLSEPAYVADESDAAGPFVLVTRPGGSVGAASATVTTSAGSAEAGADYSDVGTTVVFQDGDTSPRLVEIPILQDEDPESDETFDVSLTDPRCAPLGEQAAAEVTIADDDRSVEPADSFTIGGTVTGLEGSGLVLENLGSELMVDADGAFEFPERLPDRIPYHVSVSHQPSEPDQVCTVGNGEGTISGADITDVAVACVTPPPLTGLDPEFGADGKVSTGAGGPAEAVAIQSDGMIVTAGGTGDFVVTRHEPDGDPDPGFGGGDGIVTTDLGGIDEAFDVAIDPEGRIVVAGVSSHPGADFAVARYESDGDLDPSFGGGDGIVVTDFNLGFDAIGGVLVQPDGMIVVAGNAGVSRGPGLGFQNDFAVARYQDDGDLDPTFGGGDGKVTTSLGSDTDIGNAVALDAEDRIIVAGQVDQGDDFALVRYEDDGDVDTSFAGGIVISDFGGEEAIEGVAVRPDGRLVVAGYSSSQGTDFDYAVAQYDENGTLDLSFGGLNSGVATTDLSARPHGDDFANDLALQADGKIVVLGHNTSDTVNDLVIVRYGAGGDLDASFGDEGKLAIDFHGTGDVGQDVAVQPDGKIVAAGFAMNGFAPEFVLARALP